MIKEFSQEIINIDGQDYTLFLNRKGIVSWENITKVYNKAKTLEDKYKKTVKTLNDDKPIEIKDGDNPFDFSNSDELDEIEKDEQMVRDIYAKFYWIALYENHKLDLSKVKELFNKAEDEYGIDQLIELANLMIEKANSNQYGNKQLKKLTALSQTK